MNAAAKSPKLSPTMRAAVLLAQSNANKLMRHPGGYWSTPAFDPWSTEGRSVLHFSTNTAHALVTRGVAKYSDWQTNSSGRFPVELTLVLSKEPA